VVPGQRPVMVTLCGSTRFKKEFIQANFTETMAGRIVLSVGWWSHADADVYTPDEKVKENLDALHLRKIDRSDEILVINVGDYIGESTRREIDYARAQGKVVRFLEPSALDVAPDPPEDADSYHVDVEVPVLAVVERTDADFCRGDLRIVRSWSPEYLVGEVWQNVFLPGRVIRATPALLRERACREQGKAIQHERIASWYRGMARFLGGER
jgi:hypothetical protein